MAPSTESDKKLQAQQRRARLAAELRSNLHKRKEQARSRALQNAPDGRGEGSGPDTVEASADTGERLPERRLSRAP
jgi:hypothetical protein